MQLLCSPRCAASSHRIVARRRTPALRAFAPDSMVGLAFTQHPTPPDPDDPDYTARADFEFDARRAELDLLSACASPERIPKKRQGEYNTTAVSNEGRTFIVDNQTLEGEPAPNAELAWELHQSMEERRARFDLLLNTDSKIESLCPAWRELVEAEPEPVSDARVMSCVLSRTFVGLNCLETRKQTPGRA